MKPARSELRGESSRRPLVLRDATATSPGSGHTWSGLTS